MKQVKSMRFINLVKFAAVIMLLCLTLFVQAEPNDVNVPTLPIIPDSNLIAPGDGFVLGLLYKDKSDSKQGNTLAKLGYQYGVAQFYGTIDIEKGRYFEAAVEFESRNINKDDSVKVLSDLALRLFPEGYMVTGVAGIGYSWSGDNTAGITIAGVNIRPNEKNQKFNIELRAVTPFDENPEIRAGLVFKF